MTVRHFLAILSLAALGACASAPDPDEAVTPIGDFRIGHNIVVADAPQKGPLSRELPDEAFEAALRDAIQARLGRYDGDGLYHVGVKVEAYVLAQPGIPLILSPKSVLLLALNVWDNSTQAKLNEEPIRITAFEGLNTGVPLLSSGMTKSAEEQLENLSISAALEIEKVLRTNEETWFKPKPGQERTPFAPTTDSAEAAPPPPAN